MSTDRFAVIGDPIEHSLSPAMHTAALAAAGIDGNYEAVHVSPAQLQAAVGQLRREYRGFNVTLPHKEAILPFLDFLDPSARDVGAANTVVNAGGRLEGHNTDVGGFSAVLRQLQLDRPGLEVLVLGAGGSARAVVHALMLVGARVSLLNRDSARARRLAETASGRVAVLPHGMESLQAVVEQVDLVVNATALGLGHLADRSPLPEDVRLSPFTAVIDLIYGRRTPLLAMAAAAGCQMVDGLEMLVQQGAESFRIWTGVEPDIAAMRAACFARLEELASCSAF